MNNHFHCDFGGLWHRNCNIGVQVVRVPLMFTVQTCERAVKLSVKEEKHEGEVPPQVVAPCFKA